MRSLAPPRLTNHTTFQSSTAYFFFFSITATIPPFIISHEHAQPRRCLENVIHALDLERTALFVCPSADLIGNCLPLFWADKVWVGWVVWWWSEVEFTTDEENGEVGPAFRMDFFDPLFGLVVVSRRRDDDGMMTNLVNHVFQGVGRVD